MSIVLGDCLEVMAAMEPESVDAIVTDPPYGLEFMGKGWDRLGAKTELVTDENTDRSHPFRAGTRRVVYGTNAVSMQAWHQQWAEAAYRVAKPSAYLLAFGGTRTVHRMTVALEDAGWIIRDMLVWAYASGFPKSKASLKPAWEPIVMARKPGPLRELAIDACRIGYASEQDEATTKAGVEAMARSVRGQTGKAKHEGWARPWMDDPEKVASSFAAPAPSGRWPANLILTDPIFDGGVEGVVGGGEQRGSPIGPTVRSTDAPGGVTEMWPREVGDEMAGYGDSGTYSRFFLIPKSSRDDREPLLNPYCTCETVKLRVWQGRDPKPREQTGSTSPGRATSEATTADGNGSNTTLFGSSTSDPSDQDSTSTTSTETSRTTGSRTSKPSIASPTNGSTPGASSSTGSGGSNAESAGTSESSTSPTGTSPPKAGPSTDGAGHATSARSSRPSVCAECGKEVMPSQGSRINAHPT